MGLPQSNAILKQIRGPGSSEDYTYAGAENGPIKWAGNADAYVIEKVRTQFASPNAGGLNKAKDNSIIIPADLRATGGVPVDVRVGDRLTYNYAGADHTRKVMDWDSHLLAGMTQTVRLHLEPATVEAG